MNCPLQVAFARDPKFGSWSKPSTYSVLGVAAHAVIEAAFKRSEWSGLDIASIRAHLDEVWDVEIQRGDEGLRIAWAPSIPPRPQEWPGYSLTRARTIRRGSMLLVKSRTVTTERTQGADVEIALSDSTSGLWGRADRIEKDGKSTRIVDLKTGLNQEEPTADQRRQLLMYAVLLQRASGNWPVSIEVEDASGSRHVLPFEPTEAEAALTEVELAKKSFNESVVLEDFVAKAQPTPDRCRWCPFRVLCRPFWDALTSDWGQRAALGVVSSAGVSEGGAFVELSVESPADKAGQVMHVSRLFDPLPNSATKVAVIDWSGSAETGGAWAKWTTTVRAW
jgi:RecB family exonuclease